MRIHIATVGDEAWHRASRELFVGLGTQDEVAVHLLERDPARADALLFVDLHQHPDDPALAQLRHHALVRKYRSKVYVYDERDQPFFTFSGVYASGTPRISRRFPIVGGPYPHLLTRLTPRHQEPDLLFSFRGDGSNSRVRSAMLELSHPRAVLEDTRGVNFFDGSPERFGEASLAAQLAYAELVARSKFILCPRGSGVSSFRLYETLSAGRVPVVISNDWLPPPRVDWDACTVRIREDAVDTIPVVLENLEPCWPALVEAGQAATAAHFSPSHLWNHYATSLADLQQHPRRHVPWWAQTELLALRARRLKGAAQTRLGTWPL
jgi:hypothetical protein